MYGHLSITGNFNPTYSIKVDIFEVSPGRRLP